MGTTGLRFQQARMEAGFTLGEIARELDIDLLSVTQRAIPIIWGSMPVKLPMRSCRKSVMMKVLL